MRARREAPRSIYALNPRITVEAGKMGGKPCIRGLRFSVYDPASYLASGMTEEQILRDFPYLEKEDFQAVYEFFASIPELFAAIWKATTNFDSSFEPASRVLI
jgi:uncharacterized protein (DUF433 family)